jgi:hypothetical protein
MTFGYIYKIQFPNGKHYIGLTTTTLEQRTKEHKKTAKIGDTKCLYNALRKYEMVDTFELIEIDTADTIEELRKKEIRYILEYNSYYMDENGYNMTYGGEGINGYVFTEDDKQKQSEITKKYFGDPENRQKQSERIKKYYEENPEAKEQMSETKKKYFEANPDAGKEHSERMKKYYEENPEARQQACETTKKQFENPEARQQASKKTIKQFEDPEARLKHSEIKKKYFEDNPDAGKEHSERLKKYYENPEARQKNSQRIKKYYENNPDARRKFSDGQGKNKPFDIFTKDGTFIKTFSYQFEAKEYLQKEHNIKSTIKIGEVLAGKRNNSVGFVFKYK